MDFMSINDLFLEFTRAAVLVALLVILFLRGRLTALSRQPGWNSILVGFCLVTFASILDITDEIPGLEKFVVIGDTVYEAFIEKLPGYLLGFVLILIGFYKMIPSLQKAERNERALQESEERFRQIFDANPDPVILARLDSGAIININPAFVNQAGIGPEEAIGRNSGELNAWVCPERRDEFRAELQREGFIDNFEADFRVKDGSVRTCLISGKVLTVSGAPCMLLVLRNITRIKEAEQALLKTDQIRKEFMSTAAHELRTPLSVLIGYVELLTSPDGNEQYSRQQRDEFLEEIKEKGFVLSSLVDDLLDISRIDAGLKFDLQLEAINPDSLLRKAFEQFRVQSSTHCLTLDLAKEQGTEIVCDRQRILQVLENLLSNAVKYSPRGSRVTLTSLYHSDCYEFTVSDCGTGMTPQQAEKVFDKFYRVDSSNTAVSGLGLGMSISKMIVDAHGGTIAIDSRLGEGTKVKVKLPIQRD